MVGLRANLECMSEMCMWLAEIQDEKMMQKFAICALLRWWRGPAVEHGSLADVLSLSCARLVADG